MLAATCGWIGGGDVPRDGFGARAGVALEGADRGGSQQPASEPRVGVDQLSRSARVLGAVLAAGHAMEDEREPGQARDQRGGHGDGSQVCRQESGENNNGQDNAGDAEYDHVP